MQQHSESDSLGVLPNTPALLVGARQFFTYNSVSALLLALAVPLLSNSCAEMEHNQGGESSPTQDELGRELPENNVEYIIFVIDGKLDGRKLLNELESVRKSALQLSQSLTADYIWQRDEFNLELKNESGQITMELP